MKNREDDIKPNITLSQLSHLGVDQAGLDALRSDHEELVKRHMAVPANFAAGNVLGVGITTHKDPATGKKGPALLLLVDKLDHEAGQRPPATSASGYPVVHEEVGAIRALGGYEGNAARTEPELEQEQRQMLGAGLKEKYRPVPCGVSIGPGDRGYAGTLGCQVQSNNVLYMLSNNHVLAQCNTIPVGTAIIQPSSVDGGEVSGDVIGTLSYFVPLNLNVGETSPVDAAIAAFDHVATDPRIQRDNGVMEKMNAPVVSPVLDLDVQKSGRTTGLTKGKVTAIGLTLLVEYVQPHINIFIENVFAVSETFGNFYLPGDSGAVVTTDTKNQPVGLLFAGSEYNRTSYANTMADVLTHLSALTGHPVEIVY